LSKKLDFGGAKSQKSTLQSVFEAKNLINETLWLPNFKGRACKLDFPALHESKFAAYFTGWLIVGPEKSVKVDFLCRRVDKKSVLDPKVEKVDFKCRFF